MLLFVCLTRNPKRVAIIYLNSFIALIFGLEIYWAFCEVGNHCQKLNRISQCLL